MKLLGHGLPSWDSSESTIKKVFISTDMTEMMWCCTGKFFKAMDELDKKSLTVYENTPELEEGEKSLIRVVHDESTYFANSDQSYFWGDEGTNVLKQK